MKTGRVHHFLRVAMLLASAIALQPGAQAQADVMRGAHQYSNGVHPCFDVMVEGARLREVSRFWYNELKAVSMKVTDRKEMTGAAARIPAASADTMRIQIAVEQPKGSSYTLAHIAFFTTSGYVGPDSPERELAGCTDWVQQRALLLRRQLAQADLDQGLRQADLLERQLELLKREEQRAGDNIRKAEQRGQQATRDRQAGEERLQEMAGNLAHTDSAAAGDMRAQQKEQRMLQDKVKRAAHTMQAQEKRKEDLQWALKKNRQDQQAKQAEIERQRALVEELRTKLQNIR